jgi:ferredoxin
MGISVDRTRCVGSGLCLQHMPDVFSQDDEEGLVVLLDAGGGAHAPADLEDVAHRCPSRAISVTG